MQTNVSYIKSKISSSSSSSSSSFLSIPDWDQPFTDEDLKAIDAVEAAFQQSATTSSSVSRKRSSSPQNDTDLHKTRRHLPSSVLGSLYSPFSLSPCRADIKMRYPAMRFGGQILYSRTPAAVENAARELLQSLRSERGEMSPTTIGFDIEWRPSFRRGVLPGKAAVMQLCSGTNHCHVMHIIHSGITESLQVLLEDSRVLKVGVGIGGDSVKVLKDYHVSIKALEDLSYLANKKFGGESRSWGLQSLTEMLLCKELQKPNKIRLGNWEVDVLSKEQLQYAATDAFVSWQLYQVLKNLPDAKVATDERSEEPKLVPQ